MVQKAVILRIVLGVPLGILFMALLLFVPAGTFYWPEAWLFIAILFSYAVIAGLLLGKSSPALVKKRVSFKLPALGWDKIIILLLGIFLVALLPVAAVDAVLFRLTEMPIALKALGFAGMVFSFTLNFFVLRENAFASRIVEVQKGQKVVSTGPYAIVRHPMYAAFTAFSFCTPLALGSLYALVPGALAAIAMIARTALEDRELQKGLQGYKDYAKKVRWKLLPGVW